jgi:hypothetical protein
MPHNRTTLTSSSEAAPALAITDQKILKAALKSYGGARSCIEVDQHHHGQLVAVFELMLVV